MPFLKLQFRPGINREVTSFTNEGGWVDGNKIRFRQGFPETIGGWAKATITQFLGTCRALINWRTLTGANLIGVGTNLKYYISRGGFLSDITPIRETTSAGAVTFAATDGSDVLVVSDTAHGARLNDFVTYSGAVSLGGNVTADVLNAEHQITDIIDADSYEITLSVTANASDTGNGGASVVGEYQINTGLANSFRGDGWGAGFWSADGWGDPSTSTAFENLRLWSHTNFGEDLIINPRGGALYYWDFSSGTNNRAVAISGLSGASDVPAECNIVKLSEKDRHVLAFGCTPVTGGDIDPLLIRFSSQESFLDWTPTATNTAGDLRISSGNQIVAVEQTNQQMVVLTDSSAHTVQFLGPPFTFGVQEVASGISTAGANCAVSANDTVYWMGLGEFYFYNGVVQAIPCSVKEYVFDETFDQTKRDLVFASHNSAFSEIWWFYPCSVSGDCTRYVVYNYAQQIWYYGTLARSAWVDRGTSLNPIAAGLDGYLYNHESGLDDGSVNPPAAIASYVQSSPFDLGEGDKFMSVYRMLPDITFRNSTSVPEATFTVAAQNFPGSSTFGSTANPVVRTATVPVQQFTPEVFLRLRGRAASIRVGSDQVGTSWRLGSPRLDVRPDGRR